MPSKPQVTAEQRERERRSTDVEERTITVSVRTVVKVVLILAAIFFLYFIRDVIGLLFVSIVFASALDPWVDRLERFRLPRGLSILLMFLTLITVVGVVLYLLVPPIVSQVGDIIATLAKQAPEIDAFYRSLSGAQDASLLKQMQAALTSVNSSIGSISSGFFSVLTDFFGAITALVIIMVITFYMTVEEDGLKKFVRSIAPIEYQPYLVQKTNRIQLKMGSWLRGQLILMLIIGVITFIGLAVLGVPFALVLAVFAGLAEFVPFLGPIIAAVPAVFFAFSDSPWKAVGVIIFYAVLQQLENQVIVPKVMQKAVGLNPIVVIVVMLIGAKIAGLAGILLAVPATTIAWIFFSDIFNRKIEEDNKLEFPTGEVTDPL